MKKTKNSNRLQPQGRSFQLCTHLACTFQIFKGILQMTVKFRICGQTEEAINYQRLLWSVFDSSSSVQCSAVLCNLGLPWVMELPLRPLADISDGCSFTSISLRRDVRLCVCRNKNNVHETAMNATNSADLESN